MMTSRHITGTMYLLLELLQDGKYKGISKVAEVSFFFIDNRESSTDTRYKIQYCLISLVHSCTYAYKVLPQVC